MSSEVLSLFHAKTVAQNQPGILTISKERRSQDPSDDRLIGTTCFTITFTTPTGINLVVDIEHVLVDSTKRTITLQDFNELHSSVSSGVVKDFSNHLLLDPSAQGHSENICQVYLPDEEDFYAFEDLLKDCQETSNYQLLLNSRVRDIYYKGEARIGFKRYS